jgi:hypothetical protein
VSKLKQKGSCRDCGCTPCQVNPACHPCCRCVPKWLCMLLAPLSVEDEAAYPGCRGGSYRTVEFNCGTKGWSTTFPQCGVGHPYPPSFDVLLTIEPNGDGECSFLYVTSNTFATGDGEGRPSVEVDCSMPDAEFILETEDGYSFRLRVTTVPTVPLESRKGCDGCTDCGCVAEEMYAIYQTWDYETGSVKCEGYEIYSFGEVGPGVFGWSGAPIVADKVVMAEDCGDPPESVSPVFSITKNEGNGHCQVEVSGDFVALSPHVLDDGATFPCPLFRAEFMDADGNILQLSPRYCGETGFYVCANCPDIGDLPEFIRVLVDVGDGYCIDCNGLNQNDSLTRLAEEPDAPYFCLYQGQVSGSPEQCYGDVVSSVSQFVEFSSAWIRAYWDQTPDFCPLYEKLLDAGETLCNQVHTLYKVYDPTIPSCTWPDTLLVIPL